MRPSTTINHLIEHIEHARDIAGVDHVGLGSDYDGCDEFPDEMSDVSSFSVPMERLAERGWSSDDLAKLMGENLLRVLDQTSAHALFALVGGLIEHTHLPVKKTNDEPKTSAIGR